MSVREGIAHEFQQFILGVFSWLEELSEAVDYIIEHIMNDDGSFQLAR